MSLFIFGLGYSTTGLARQAQRDNWHITSTSRDVQRYAPLATPQHRLVHFDPARGTQLNDDAVQALHQSHYVISSIPPVAARLYDPVIQAQHRALWHVTSEPRCNITALAYLSSTGVYGDWKGDWVDESCEPRTATARGLLRLEAEEAWAELADRLQVPLTIFRLGGIYGPMRSVLHILQQQKTVEAPARSSAVRRSRQRYTSRCHVADVVAAVQADMLRWTQPGARQQQVIPYDLRQQQEVEVPQQQLPGIQVRQQPVKTLQGGSLQSSFVDIINVVDDEPAPRAAVEAFAVQLLDPRDSRRNQQTRETSSQASGLLSDHGQDYLQQQEPVAATGQQVETSQAVASAGKLQDKGPKGAREPLEEKRVRNDKLKRVLGVQLLAATYREGLSVMHEGSIEPFVAADLSCLYGQKSCMAEP